MADLPCALSPLYCQVVADALPDLLHPRPMPASVVDSHSSALCFNLPYEAKTPAIADEGFL
ncbi:hypothetical protein DJ549_24830 [Klebsiella grimontii]|nr:hypothetical protein DJ549_24830 [Klebsiella grimontii]